jgi:hypothetical protein
MTKKDMLEKLAREFYENYTEYAEYMKEVIELKEESEIDERRLRRKERLKLRADEKMRQTEKIAEMFGLNIQKMKERSFEIEREEQIKFNQRQQFLGK